MLTLQCHDVNSGFLKGSQKSQDCEDLWDDKSRARRACGEQGGCHVLNLVRLG